MKYNYRGISRNGQTWINDLKGSAPETRFPDLDPSDMTESERDKLADYLRQDDGSLSESDMRFSSEVADEIEALEPE